MNKDNYRIKKTIENERKLNEIAHTTKEANKYFSKLKYIVNNFEKLEEKIKELEEKIKALGTSVSFEILERCDKWTKHMILHDELEQRI